MNATNECSKCGAEFFSDRFGSNPIGIYNTLLTCRWARSADEVTTWRCLNCGHEWRAS